MRIIKLDATRSTNATLKDLWHNDHAVDWTVVWAMHQLEGRGQKGTNWESEAGKNLTFSVLKKFTELEVRHQFLMNMAVSLAVYDALKKLKIPDVCVKWPNDIMSGSLKICGILIENIVKAKRIKAAIIGIGLNINQEDFGKLEGAASLKTITGLDYDLESVLEILVESLKLRLEALNSKKFEEFKTSYEQVMYRINETSVFKSGVSEEKKGIIRGISNDGKILIEFDQSTSAYDLKEIRILD